MNRYQVIFYKDSRGRQLVQEFINAQDTSTRSKFAKLFNLLQIYGPELMMPYAKYLKDGMYELRLRGKNEVRIFYIWISGNQQKVVLLHAFKKQSQKIPAKELAVARTRQKELTGI
ncbi:type II toxin-antitoxin system RelE/ParE family toxin [Candidatus Saccharibacteria bacterium]|nr:type II toxin-antitoxin system RelE/ParE family toxin [Candidatus Saccharibacteria bacterium]